MTLVSGGSVLLEVPSSSNATAGDGKRRSVLRGSAASTRKSKSKGGPRVHKRASIALAQVDGTLPPPGPPSRQVDAWQMKEETVMDRVMVLFNSVTMSDIIFHVGMREIPAHKFVLSSASPVLHSQIQDVQSAAGGQLTSATGRLVHMTTVAGSSIGEGLLGTMGCGTNSRASSARRSRTGPDPYLEDCGEIKSDRIIHVEVNEKYEDFFEFMRFLYTDQIVITLKNVAALIFMSDDFKLPSLSDKCLAYLRLEVRAETALRILNILKVLMKKAVLALWREVLLRAKAVRAFKELSHAERQRRLMELREGMSDATSSYVGSRSMSRLASKESIDAFSEGGTSRMSRASGGYSKATFTSGATATFFDHAGDPSGLRKSDIMKLTADGNVGNKYAQVERNLYTQLALVSEELSEKCWRMVREGTGAVVAGDDWVDQEIGTIRKILNMDMCAVSEAHLFRALNRWAEHQCKLRNLPLLPEYRRKVLGEQTLELVRFATMTFEELKWEVTPTGLLKYQELRNLQRAVTNRGGWLPTFNGEKRLQPLQDLIDGKKNREKDDGSPTESGVARSSGVYVPLEGDELDAVLGARLWRSYVEHFVEEQEDVGLAHEAGVPLGSEVDVRPVLCGNLMEFLVNKKDKDAPHRRTRDLLRRPGAKSPMEMLDRELSSEAPPIRPSSSLAAPSSARQVVQATPRAGTAPGGSRSSYSAGQALPPVYSARGGADGWAEPARKPASSSWLRDAAPREAAPTMVLGSAAIGMEAQASVAPSGASASGWSRRPAVPADFQRLGQGFYRFRRDQLIELRLVNGDPFVFEHGRIDPTPNNWDSLTDSDSGIETEEQAVLRRFNLSARSYVRSVPLDTFIFRT